MNVQTVLVIFNRRLGEDRRELYYPTRIASASYMEARRESHAAGVHSESASFKLRIPYDADQDGKTYTSEAAFKSMSDEEAAKRWTLQKGDIVITADFDQTDPVDATELDAIACRLSADIITVTEYADNTMRGTDVVKHWRIGGE